MIQEIITYMVIGAAITVAFYKIRKKFGKNKNSLKSLHKITPSQHNCPDCTAECILRDSAKQFDGNDLKLCRKDEVTNA